MEKNKEKIKNIISEKMNNKNSLSFQNLVKLQKLIKTESAMRDICKNKRIF
jgi:hypothetical protein